MFHAEDKVALKYFYGNKKAPTDIYLLKLMLFIREAACSTDCNYH